MIEVAAPKLMAILLDIQQVTDREERSELLIEFAERFKEVPANIARRPFSRNHLVPACESQAYAWAERYPNGTYSYHFAVENPQGISAKALAVILSEGLSGEDPQVVQKTPQDLIYDIFGRSITMGRGHGLMSMIAMVKALSV